jgi:hypothetical protein
MKDSSLEKTTAYHEAGHAVAASLVRMRFPQVTIVPANNHQRLCELAPGRDYAYDGATDRRTIERAKAHIFVHVAGPSAESRSGDRLRLDVFEEHHWRAHYIAGWFIRNFVTLQAYVDFIWKRTNDYLNTHWEAVEVVARALLTNQTLTKREVRRLMRSTLREFDDFPRPNLL